MKFILVLALLGLVLAEAVYLVSSQRGGIITFGGRQEYQVVLKEDGFYPKELKIKKGDIVTFTTTRNKPFWPASDLHPTHTIYPQFDPKEPIDEGGSWSFTFEKKGSWKYHDHLNPLFKGVINVTEGAGFIKSARAECRAGDTECISGEIDKVLDTQGVEAAFEVLASYYDSSGNCHGFAHKIGEKAYFLFAQKKDLSIGRKTYYCGYGFYHSFMETLLQEGGDTNLAEQFCNYTIKSTGLPSAWTACYHGIGHGAVDGGDPRAWGDAKAMIKSAFDLCHKVSETSMQSYLCASGIYNAIEILSHDPKYKIKNVEDQPFKFCDTQPKEYQEPCYTNMIPTVLGLSGQAFKKAANYIEENIKDPNSPTIDGYTTREMVILSLFHEFIRINLAKDNYVKVGVDLCRSLPTHSKLACFEGLSGGHMKYGEPEKEYIKWQAFCGSELLLTDEKEACYKYVLTRIGIWYTSDKAKEICDSIPEEYRRYCNV